MAALAAVAARRSLGGRRLVAVLSVLDDKDAAGDAPRAAAAVRRGRLHAEREPARAAAGDARVAGRPARRAARRASIAEPARARWRARARLAGPDGVALATGSIYLIADLLRPAGAAREVDAVNDDGPSMLAMIALVAVIVALVILVFFALGYGFGRLFL